MTALQKYARLWVNRFVFGIASLIIFSCSDVENTKTARFTAIDPDDSGIDFVNKLTFNQEFNIYTYRNYYNGGGVGLGDINNDGLIDVYLTGNMIPNKLYLNEGQFRFKDITTTAGVAGTRSWSTGVSMADVNGDGWLDIYVCNSGDIKGDNKQNELFINNGDNTFTERAEEYNVADKGYTTHAAFFDYDKDDDLDLYILNNSYQAIGSFNLRKNERPKRDALGGDKLLRNDGGHFVDVSAEAGIYGSVIGFGLGVTIGDINNDDWPDIYVSNDFFERDYLYINKKDGTFSEELPKWMKSVSGASMGADMADINNDGNPDIFVTEMLPRNNERIKTVTTFENWDRYQYNLQNDYYHQFTRNMLQLSNGDGTFSEIGRLSDVAATDWSWGALMFDMNNDGKKDIFVANGIYQDLTNQDYLQYVSNEEVVRSVVSKGKVDYKKLVDLIPSTPVPNFAFENQGSLGFIDRAEEWGLGAPGFSNGSAYGDLDNDGDLDLVVSNVNATTSVFRNETNTIDTANRYLKFELKGKGGNTGAFGTKIRVKHQGQLFYVEQMPIRGFESSMDPRPIIGLGTIDTVELIEIRWPDSRVTTLKNVATNQVIRLQENDDAKVADEVPSPEATIHFKLLESPLVYQHRENTFVDFDRDRLTFQMLSNEGPGLATADVNGDGLEDVFIGGAKDSPGGLFIQKKNGQFQLTQAALWEQDQASEDTRSLFFDADGDGDKDLYVCSGGNEFSSSSLALIDRLYQNDGKGNFKKTKQVLPGAKLEITSTVQAADVDADGDIDLFVGARLQPQQYGLPADGYLLINDGKGTLKDETELLAPALRKLGMITDAAWNDIDQDGDQDLLVVGEYMPVRVFINDRGKLTAGDTGLIKSEGWWNRIVAADIDKDGDMDFILGNHGLNSRFKADRVKPVCMYVNDFDRNGTIEHIVCTYVGDKSYPLALRHDLLSQIPSLKKKYLKYESYKNQTIGDIFTPEQMKDALQLNAYEMASVVLLNNGTGKFEIRPLPVEAQLSPIHAIIAEDLDGDGAIDLLLGGNQYRVKPEIGRYDASYGVLLKGNGKGDFVAVSNAVTGLHIDGEVRDMAIVKTGGRNLILIARNNDTILSLTTGK
jgi:enediyne biosynthesis protein E4